MRVQLNARLGRASLPILGRKFMTALEKLFNEQDIQNTTFRDSPGMYHLTCRKNEVRATLYVEPSAPIVRSQLPTLLLTVIVESHDDDTVTEFHGFVVATAKAFQSKYEGDLVVELQIAKSIEVQGSSSR